MRKRRRLRPSNEGKSQGPSSASGTAETRNKVPSWGFEGIPFGTKNGKGIEVAGRSSFRPLWGENLKATRVFEGVLAGRGTGGCGRDAGGELLRSRVEGRRGRPTVETRRGEGKEENEGRVVAF